MTPWLAFAQGTFEPHENLLVIDFFLGALVSFFIGSLPFGYWAGLVNRIDIRTEGSGNIGTTNVFRVLGKKWGTIVFVADVLKGFIPVFLAAHWVIGPFSDLFQVFCGMCAILGHNYTPFLRFKGGKGIATSAGVLLGIMPLTLACALSSWIIILALFRYVSVASICAALILPVATWFFYRDHAWLLGAAVVMCILAIVRHRANIVRLYHGTELKMGQQR